MYGSALTIFFLGSRLLLFFRTGDEDLDVPAQALDH
jgi:hypothetical protein